MIVLYTEVLRGVGMFVFHNIIALNPVCENVFYKINFYYLDYPYNNFNC